MRQAVAIRPGLGPALGEAEATPACVVVHDPSATRALDVLAEVPPERLKERCLFSVHPDSALVAEQHAALVGAVRGAGVEVVRLADLVGGTDEWRDAETNPNQIYTRDSAITIPWLPGWYIGCAMRMPVRRPEVATMAAALRALGLRELFTMPHDSFLEGGDLIPFARDGRRVLLLGYGPRTARRSVDVLAERLIPWAVDEIVAVRLDESRMNLDGVLVPVADDTVVTHPGSIEDAFVRDERGERPVDLLGRLRSAGMGVVEVTLEESKRMQATNCLCLGERRVVCYDLAARVVDELAAREIDVLAVPGSELIKGTGGPRCMTRPVYG